MPLETKGGSMSKATLAALLALTLGVAALGQVEPKGIIIEPPTPEGLTVQIWVDKPVYTLDEYVQIHFQVNKPAYIYIWDIQPDGLVRQIFPNHYEPDNFFQSGTHTPRSSRFRVAPPTGTEWLQIMATTQPVPGIWGEFSAEVPFPLLGEDPEAWQMRLRVQIQGLVPEPTERAFDFTSFDIVSGPAPGHGTLQVNTTPPLAWLYVDEIFRGFTPESVLLRAGWHDVLIRKDGYQDHSTRVYITGGRTRTLNVTLTPIAVNQPPVASFTRSPFSPRPGEWVTFDASSSHDPDGTIVSYRWDFENDGAFDAFGKVVHHQFPIAGTYNVRLVVTDNVGATGQTVQPVSVTPPVNQPPVAQFTVTPLLPIVGELVTFDGTSSYDPDGTIVSYQWDLDGDGMIDRYGSVVSWTYPVPGSYWVTLSVGDDQGAIGQAQQEVQVVPAGPPGMPPMDGIPGIYVWGTDAWNITVNGSPSWTMPHAYRLELRTDGTFVGVSAEAGPAPLGLVPEPVSEGWRVVFEGSVVSDQVTYTFRVTGATSIYMDLRLDMDGDGALDRSTGFVHLRQFMVNPPNSPFAVGLPEGYDGPFVPSLNFRIGTALAYTEHSRIVFWQTTIEALEGR